MAESIGSRIYHFGAWAADGLNHRPPVTWMREKPIESGAVLTTVSTVYFGYSKWVEAPFVGTALLASNLAAAVLLTLGVALLLWGMFRETTTPPSSKLDDIQLDSLDHNGGRVSPASSTASSATSSGTSSPPSPTTSVTSSENGAGGSILEDDFKHLAGEDFGTPMSPPGDYSLGESPLSTRSVVDLDQKETSGPTDSGSSTFSSSTPSKRRRRKKNQSPQTATQGGVVPKGKKAPTSSSSNS